MIRGAGTDPRKRAYQNAGPERARPFQSWRRETNHSPGLIFFLPGSFSVCRFCSLSMANTERTLAISFDDASCCRRGRSLRRCASCVRKAEQRRFRDALMQKIYKLLLICGHLRDTFLRSRWNWTDSQNQLRRKREANHDDSSAPLWAVSLKRSSALLSRTPSGATETQVTSGGPKCVCLTSRSVRRLRPPSSPYSCSRSAMRWSALFPVTSRSSSTSSAWLASWWYSMNWPAMARNLHGTFTCQCSEEDARSE